MRHRFAAASAAVLLLTVTLVGPSPARAAEFVVEFPTGIACPDFDLRLEGDDDVPVSRSFTDRDGNERALLAGRARPVTATNLASGEQLVIPGRGVSIWTTNYPDGSQRVTVSGTVLLVMYPTDIPAGPSTTVITGRLVYTVDADFVYTIVSVKGQQTDVCAALADD